VVVDFIIEHHIELERDIDMVDKKGWRLIFDGSVCSKGHIVGCFIISPSGVEYELSIRLEFECTNNQTKYEALLSGLEALVDMEAKDVYVYGDSQLVVHQMNGINKCLDGNLNEYRCKCLEFVEKLGEVSIIHIPCEQNEKVNTLAQQASGYDIRQGVFEIRIEPMLRPVLDTLEGGDESAEGVNRRDEDWRLVFIRYINDPNSNGDCKVRHQALCYMVIDGSLYRRNH
jgi:ribonuclease HI